MSLMSRLLWRLSAHLPMRVINDGERQYLVRYYVGTLFGWRFYLHQFVGSDPDRGLHDHPWSKAYSLILSGWYWEQTRSGTRRVRWFNSLTGDTFHRVVLPNFTDEQECIPGFQYAPELPCWTLFFHRVGNVKPWGFWHSIKDDQYGECAYFQPYIYSREGKQDNWWLKAPKRFDV